MSQRDIFLATEGDNYHRRNKAKFAGPNSKVDQDSVFDALLTLDLKPTAILEIGCEHGWRLNNFNRKYGAQCVGVEPSREAIADGCAEFPSVRFVRGTAESLGFKDETFDLVVFGHVLYVCDPKYLFRIATEGDRVLRDKGHIVIVDFHPPFPYQNSNKHDSNLTTYKMDYPNLFLWNPAYTLLYQVVFDYAGGPSVANPDNRMAVSVLVKDMSRAYPLNPFTTA